MSQPLAAKGEFALVQQHLEFGLGRPDMHTNLTPAGTHDFYAMLADVAAQQHDLAALRQYAPQAEALAARYGHSLYLAIAHRAWGVAHRLDGSLGEAESRLQQALALFEGLGTRWQIGRTWYELGEVAQASGRTAQAREHFTRALESFETMQAAPDAERTRAALADLA